MCTMTILYKDGESEVEQVKAADAEGVAELYASLVNVASVTIEQA